MRAEFGFRSTLLTTATREVRLQPDTCIPARVNAGTKETWQQTNQHQLRWHLLKENICLRALWDKVFVTQEVIYFLVIDITHLRRVPICWLDHVTHQWGDSEEELHRLHDLLKIHSPTTHARLQMTSLCCSGSWFSMEANNTKVISLMHLSYYHLTRRAELSLRKRFFAHTLKYRSKQHILLEIPFLADPLKVTLFKISFSTQCNKHFVLEVGVKSFTLKVPLKFDSIKICK